MLYIKKPSVVTAYVFGLDDEAIQYVKSGDNGFFVITDRGLVIQVRKGDYIIPVTTNPLTDPRAISINPKVFKKHYKLVDYKDAEIIKDEE